jgi:glutathione-independent formaldehyde dehydrogenase
MKAVTWQGRRDIRVEEVADPAIEKQTDAVIRVTSTGLCGSDLHLYEPLAPFMSPGDIVGHEPMGEVVEVGADVRELKVGDRVVVPFNISCGTCWMCRQGLHSQCETTQNREHGTGASLFGYSKLYGQVPGGQAEYLRVPFADFNALRLPEGDEHETAFAMLADIFPTGYHSTELADVRPGDSVAVFGAGPVGQMAVYSALLRGAAKVYAVDRVESRLEMAASIGAIPVDFSETDPVETIVEDTSGGVDKGIDAVGYQATVSDRDEEQPAVVLNQLIGTVRPTGRLGIVGLYVPEDPGAPSDEAKEGRLLIEIGKLFEKGLAFGTGQANVKRYNRHLRDLIIEGRADPSFVVSKELPLDEAPEAYERFDNREQGYSKVVLHPHAA